MSKEFCYTLRVRYAECDAQKVVFNGRYVDYMDIAINEYMRQIWGDYNQNILARGIDFQVVHIDIDWQAPAHFDEVLAATVTTNRIGNTSFALAVNFTNHETDQQIAHGNIVYVMVSSEEHQKVVIPDDLKQRLQQGAKNSHVDHSGLQTQPAT